jgi:hypothetical protein
MVGTRAHPEDTQDAFTSRLYPDSLPLDVWQRKWRNDLVSIGHPGNGLYVISDVFSEYAQEETGRETYHITAGYSTRIAERFSMEYARLWPQRGRIRVHWILPLPAEWPRSKVREIEQRMHKYCAIHARMERLRTTEFYRARALPLLYACFESIVREYGLDVPYHMDTALNNEYCWVYSRPTEPIPRVNIFERALGRFQDQWRTFRKEQMDLMAPFRVQSPAAIARLQAPRTRSNMWSLRPRVLGGALGAARF